MKVRKEWLSANFGLDNLPDSSLWSWAPFKGSDVVEIPDEWVMLMNQKHQISNRGRYLFLTRVGWIANRDEIKQLCANGKSIPWDQVEARVEQSLTKMENGIIGEFKRVAVQFNVMEKYLAANIPLRPAP
jgi:hypothetical protein